MTCRYKKTRNIVYIVMGTICVWGILYAIFVINLSHRYNSWASAAPSVPIVVTTWPFVNATNKAWESVYFQKYSAVESIELGCRVCEREQCDFTVGYGGSPDESGETTVEALIMDGKTMNVGAVANLRRIKNAISVARHVLEYTSHSLLSGDQATEFAKKMGFKEESLSTNYSHSMWKKWTEKKCQPNFWMNVKPDSKSQCGPYKPIKVRKPVQNYNEDMFNEKNHDTIGMVVIDSKNNIAAGTSTNGAKYKIPGRIGDSPIPGAGAYADNSVGGAAATGDGDVMLRFLPSFLAVEEMRKGASPTEAANTAINRIASKYSSFFGGVIAVDMMGNHGAACHGMEKFHYSICNAKLGQVTVKSVPCLNIEL